MQPIALPPKEAFAMLSIGRIKGYELIAAGEVEVFKIGRSTRITVASILAFMERQIAI
ncbi:helix-turn-helix domain-containing protein [Sphingomonas sp. LH128]|uniref:helix-turn-helix domain-containing protein n=1 Tax=Sphingomonas sp. LH128 TaxID=473781 RepID=UPI00031AF74B|nr:helix-turn-helix domain-containing protein [Sphingomonas sp. LH128]